MKQFRTIMKETAKLLGVIYKIALLVMMISIGKILSVPIFAEEISTRQEASLSEMIQDVKMSMPLTEFVKVRQNARHFGFFEDNKIDLNKPSQILDEYFEEKSIFDQALYSFDHFALDAVVLFAERIDVDNRDKFLGEILRLYGEPEDIVLVLQEGKYQYSSPGLIWHRNDTLIMANFTMDAPEGQPIYYEFKAFNTSATKPKPFYIVPITSELERLKTIESTKSLISRLSKKT